MTISIGNITEVKGEIVRGEIDLITHPTGSKESLAVIIASGKNDGPTFLLTANIHGDEIVGVIIIHRLLEMIDLDELHGRIVCIPSLNPTGNRRAHRYPQFDHADPNRKWPDSNPDKKKKEDKNDWLDRYYEDVPTPQETIWKRLIEEFKNISPDYHIDLHTFSNLSIPFVFMDRIIYEEDENEANKLFDKLQSMVKSMGLTIVVESPARRYVDKKLHRSTSGATLNLLKIPSCTIELGLMHSADPSFRDAGLKAVLNFMDWAKMNISTFQPITEAPVIMTKKWHRYIDSPRTPETGILDILKEAGDMFSKGDILAIVRDISGVRIGEVKADMDGFIVGWENGIAKYKNEMIGMIAVEDKMPMVVKWSEIDWEDKKEK